MIDYTIKKCPLFNAIDEDQLEQLLNCLMPKKLVYGKDEFIFRSGDKVQYVGIVISGGIRIIHEDFWGNRTILTNIEPSGLFGEAFSCAGTEEIPISAVSSQKTRIMTIDYRKIITACTSSCAFHMRLIMNMLAILAEKNILLTQRSEHLSKRTIREKILSYLSAQASLLKTKTIEIPFNRQELADYLCIDRSALSRELSLMQKEGVIVYRKNHFTL